MVIKKVIRIILLSMFLHFTFANLINIVNQIKNELFLHPKLTLYVYENKISKPASKFFLQNLMQQIPSKVIHLEDISGFVNSSSDDDPYNYKASAPMHVALIEEGEFANFSSIIEDVITYIGRTLFYKTRTKYLFGFFFNNYSTNAFKTDLIKFWKSKSLIDFTIIQVDLKSNPSLIQ